MAQMLVHVAKGKTLNSADLAINGKYYNSIVFDENTGAIYARGGKFGSIEEATKAIAELKYFNKVAGNTGDLAGAATPGSVLNIKGDGTYVTTSVGESGVTITGKNWTNEIAEATAVGTSAQEDATLALSDAADALAEALKKVASVKEIANKGIEIGGTATDPTVGIKIDTTTAGNVILSVGANGLKGQVTLPTVDYPVTSVGSITDSAVKVDPTTKDVKVGLNLDTSGNVTLSQSATGLKAAIDLSGYVTKEQFESLKDVFVKEGSVVKGTFSGTSFTESTSGNDTALKLVLENQSAPIYINVASLVDIYDGSKLLLKEITTETAYTAPVANQSVDKAISLLIKGVANALAKADEAANKSVGVESFGGQDGVITVDTTTSGANGHVQFTMSGKNLTAKVDGLGTAAYSAVGAFATSDQGAKADTALQSVTAEGAGHLTLSGSGNKVSGSLKTQALASATSTTDGLATANDTKIYVDGLWAWEEL